MANKVFRTPVELKNYLQVLCDKAVENACNRILGALQQIILEEYYNMFDPDYYNRTYQFFESAVTEMLKASTGVIFMDEVAMNYGTFWSGKRQLYEANVGSHGGWVTDDSKDHHFWEVFEDYCRENTVQILKEELKKVRLNIK